MPWPDPNPRMFKGESSELKQGRQDKAAQNLEKKCPDLEGGVYVETAISAPNTPNMVGNFIASWRGKASPHGTWKAMSVDQKVGSFGRCSFSPAVSQLGIIKVFGNGPKRSPKRKPQGIAHRGHSLVPYGVPAI